MKLRMLFCYIPKLVLVSLQDTDYFQNAYLPNRYICTEGNKHSSVIGVVILK